MSIKNLFLLLSLIVVLFCKDDPSTLSNYKHITQTNLEGNFFIDFDKNIFRRQIQFLTDITSDSNVD